MIGTWTSCQICKMAGCACAGNAGNVFPATAGWRSRHASRHVRHACAVMHVGIANWRFPLKSVAGKTFPTFPVHAQPTMYVSGKRSITCCCPCSSEVTHSSEHSQPCSANSKLRQIVNHEHLGMNLYTHQLKGQFKFRFLACLQRGHVQCPTRTGQVVHVRQQADGYLGPFVRLLDGRHQGLFTRTRAHDHLAGKHYIDVIMTTQASQITSLTVVYSIVYLGADQRKHQSSVSQAFVRGIHRDGWIPHTKGQ